MPSTKNPNEIMTVKEVAEFLSLHPLTVQKMAREGKIPGFKIGTDWRFHRKILEKWINEKIEYHLTGRERRNLQKTAIPPKGKERRKSGKQK